MIIWIGVLSIFAALLVYEPINTSISSALKKIGEIKIEDDKRLKDLYEPEPGCAAGPAVHKPVYVEPDAREAQHIHFGVAQGFKFGFGFAAGFVVFCLLLSVVGMSFFAGALGTMAKALPGPAVFLRH